MKYLFIDTETTGLPLDDSFSIGAINNWPRLVSVNSGIDVPAVTE